MTEVSLMIWQKIYCDLPFAFLFAFLILFFYQHKEEKGLWGAIKLWGNRFRKEKAFRGTFLTAFYAVLVLYRTVLGRSFRKDRFSGLFTGWGFFADVSKDATDAAQNVVLLFPFIFLLFYYHGEKIWKDRKLYTLISKSCKIAFFFSLGIETTQGVLGFGSFQLADLVYNTLGGVLGAIIYYFFILIRREKD